MVLVYPGDTRSDRVRITEILVLGIDADIGEGIVGRTDDPPISNETFAMLLEQAKREFLAQSGNSGSRGTKPRRRGRPAKEPDGFDVNTDFEGLRW
jgi:hypothetical protein